MAQSSPRISAADLDRLRRALGQTALCTEACELMVELSPASRAVFVTAVGRAAEAGETGHHAIWAGMTAVANSAIRRSKAEKGGA